MTRPWLLWCAEACVCAALVTLGWAAVVATYDLRRANGNTVAVVRQWRDGR